ncbi:ATP-binding cassette domain-containing protein [Apilactobacillus sp. TMW 2.2459]|uniref:ATP-binding cassette domain-containing protein n=1 Tax=Apilactobacillus xinyiensis TaxID=2841032 RepID=UPI00200F0D44|nr:ATP-binding cassette domain-containing protein [Apilactobacillus xinyiensis]MCL0312511.1 ATP-binding cassette domain-containing protein [Apilactobacillus xinyiensis]MCL0330198.1 ATP-binding cassette domain-containing protein [Apilactobacillus xinyiensis]
MKKILEVSNLDVKLKERTLISRLSFEINSGTLTCITGENGVGKTTMVKTLLKNFKNNNHVTFHIKRNQVQYVPQLRNIDDDYPLMIKDFIGLGLQNKLLPWLSKKEKLSIEQVMNETNLAHLARTPLGKASGGEQQRVFLAQALVSNPKLLILDESTASMDKDAKIELLKLVKNITEKTDTAVIFITHDPLLVQKFGDYDLEIKNQKGILKSVKGVNN